MTEIKHKITNLLKSIDSGNVQYEDLEETLDYILDNNVSKNEAFSFLDLMHLSSISKTISSHDSNQWAMKIAQVIDKHNFHTGQLLLQREKRYKDKVAIHTIDGDKKIDITYSKLWNDVLKTSLAIKKASNNQISIVGILSHNQYKSAVVDLACLSSGIRIIPIPLNATRDHLLYIIKEANISHLFLGGERAIQLWNSTKYEDELIIIDVNDIGSLQNKSVSWEIFHDKFFQDQKYDNMNELSDQDMNSTITIMYTSGSTSNPKGVKFSQLNIISKRFSRALALPDISDKDKFLCYLPLFHTFGRYFELMGSIFWGATYTFAESPSFNSLLKDFRIISPTIFISIPKRWVQIYELMNDSLDLDLSTEEEINTKLKDMTGGSLKWGLSAAGYLDPDIFIFFHDNNINLMSGYGMTEATGGITMTPPNEYVEDTVGIALPGIDLKIEEDGELCMKGPYISKGLSLIHI